MSCDREQIDRFLKYIQIEKRLSALTIKHYQLDLNQLLSFCTDQDIADWNSIDSFAIRQFISQRHRSGLAASSLE